MKNVQNHTLLHQTIEPSEASDVLLSLINEKIKFLNLKNLISHERMNMADTNSISQIESLKKSRTDIMELIDNAKTNGHKLNINTEIRITVE